mmetsp:Transcript_40525/g.82824  ORF Transcript_40525/g.82824 Transcript_40525/m.82824 type:complete len:101 (+) Transcript_40525:49-351(+)|eukprot:CAMPEP_0181297168 /NCGR_PEP_ID=MMETSP1101-20121128/5092_1 /TAXON_ID=46948 /ORGANISM="Rhodomonas abbreviata, Strain Caron Lab Isolate" /LENGTH=100 /DNA_ID=CAMNT_0023402079 /DNA_START=49 /DNA_END=351 /DNA_ORIENTATION=+
MGSACTKGKEVAPEAQAPVRKGLQRAESRRGSGALTGRGGVKPADHPALHQAEKENEDAKEAQGTDPPADAKDNDKQNQENAPKEGAEVGNGNSDSNQET